MLRKQQGLPQLLGLGVLFILAASFFAVQLWSGVSTPRGAASALQPPPMMPPSYQTTARTDALPSPESDSGFIEVVDFEPADDEIEVVAEAEVTEEPEVEVVEAPAEVEAESVVEEPSVKVVAKQPVKQPARAAARPRVEKQPAAVEAPKSVEASKADTKPQNALQDSAKAKREAVSAGFVEAPPIKEEPKVIAAKAVKPAVRPAEKKPEPVPTEIPPEWNWFSKPLRVDMSDGKVAIVADKAASEIKLTAHEKVAVPAMRKEETSIRPVIEPVVVADAEPVLSVEDEYVSAETVAVEAEAEARPFEEAVARIRKVRSERVQRERVRAYQPVTANARDLKPSRSMIRVRDYLRYMQSASAYERALIADFSIDGAVSGSVVTPARSGGSQLSGVRPYRAEGASVSAFRLQRGALRYR